jgi:hypothetical protein
MGMISIARISHANSAAFALSNLRRSFSAGPVRGFRRRFGRYTKMVVNKKNHRVGVFIGLTDQHILLAFDRAFQFLKTPLFKVGRLLDQVKIALNCHCLTGVKDSQNLPHRGKA